VCVPPKWIPRIDVGVEGGVSRPLETVLLSKFMARGAEKSTEGTMESPVLKLTQVGEESILRRSRELRLRN
jgi:hypothetical protein